MDKIDGIANDGMARDLDALRDDDEVTLISLLAVLLRYRKMIVLGTLAVTIVAALYLVALPRYRLSRAEAKAGNPSPEEMAAAASSQREELSLSDYAFALSGDLHDLSYAVSVTNIPPFLKTFIDSNYGIEYTDLSVYFNAVYSDLSVLAPIYLRYNLWPPKADPANAAEAAAYVAELRKRFSNSEAKKAPVFAVNDEVLSFGLAGNSLATVISLLSLPQYAVIPYESNGEQMPPLSLQFARDVVEEANRQAEEAILPFMQSIVQASADDPLVNPAAAQAAENFLKGYRSFFELYEMPAMSPSEKSGGSPKLKVVFAAFVGLFLFAVLAFCRSAIASIRQDPRSMKLLEDAWKEKRI